MIQRTPAHAAPPPSQATPERARRRPGRRAGGILGVLILAVLGACQGDGGIGAATLSELQGLPVPDNAEIAARDAGTADAPILVYRVPGATHEQLKRWYGREMPVGEDWEGWTWCDSEENESGFFRYYHRPGEALLSVILAPDAGILLSYTTSGRC